MPYAAGFQHARAAKERISPSEPGAGALRLANREAGREDGRKMPNQRKEGSLYPGGGPVKDALRTIGMVALDIAVILLAVVLALQIRFEGRVPATQMGQLWRYVAIALPAHLVALVLSRAYSTLWELAGYRDVLKLAVATAAATCVTVLIAGEVSRGLSRGTLLIAGLLALLFFGGVRSAVRVIGLLRSQKRRLGPAKRVLIAGAGEAGRYSARLYETSSALNGRPILFVDDDPAKQGKYILGCKVRGTIDDIPRLAAKYSIDCIVLAIPSISRRRFREIAEICHKTRCEVMVSYLPKSMDGETISIRKLDFSDLLFREEVHLNNEKILNSLQGRTVLVTGGGGSIGSEICRQVIKYSPKAVIVFDIYENCAYELQCELRELYGKDVPVEVVIGSIRDVERLRFVMERYRPDVVFHAAAHKHVPLMETSPYEAIKNNILGTRNVLEAASRCGVRHFVQISTDKAVNPTNVMGTTKRVTELLVKYYAQHTPMKCIAVRFGNVLGSHGSVIPLLEHQIESGGPVTITHPDIVRFFMTIEEAAQLILHANAEERTNTIFVLDMGRPVKILDLAKQLIAFHGLRPDEDIQIVYTGLRPGEKMYEELLYDNEDKVLLPTSNERIMALNDGEHCMDGLPDLIDRLGALAEAEDPAAIAQLQALVPNARLGIAG